MESSLPWASLAHFILSYFLHSYGLLLSLLGFLGPITASFLWAPLACFCFISISYNSHGLITSFFGAFLVRLLSLWLFYYFVGLWTIIPAILAQWSLLCYFLSLPFPYCWGFSAIGPFCQKWASTIFYLTFFTFYVSFMFSITTYYVFDLIFFYIYYINYFIRKEKIMLQIMISRI